MAYLKIANCVVMDNQLTTRCSHYSWDMYGLFSLRFLNVLHSHGILPCIFIKAAPKEQHSLLFY